MSQDSRQSKLDNDVFILSIFNVSKKFRQSNFDMIEVNLDVKVNISEKGLAWLFDCLKNLDTITRVEVSFALVYQTISDNSERGLLKFKFGFSIVHLIIYYKMYVNKCGSSKKKTMN